MGRVPKRVASCAWNLLWSAPCSNTAALLTHTTPRLHVCVFCAPGVVDWRRPSCWSFKLFKWSARRNGRIRWDGAVGWSRLWSVLLVPSFFGKNWKGWLRAIGPGQDKRKEAKRNKVVQLLTWKFTGGNGGRFCLQSTVEQFCGSVYVLNTGLATHRKPLVTCKRRKVLALVYIECFFFLDWVLHWPS